MNTLAVWLIIILLAGILQVCCKIGIEVLKIRNCFNAIRDYLVATSGVEGDKWPGQEPKGKKVRG